MLCFTHRPPPSRDLPLPPILSGNMDHPLVRTKNDYVSKERIGELFFLNIIFTDQGVGDAWNQLPAKSGSDCRAGWRENLRARLLSGTPGSQWRLRGFSAQLFDAGRGSRVRNRRWRWVLWCFLSPSFSFLTWLSCNWFEIDEQIDFGWLYYVQTQIILFPLLSSQKYCPKLKSIKVFSFFFLQIINLK